MTEQTRKKRRAVVAVLLSLPVWGLGHLYNGQVRRALILFAVTLAIPFVWAAVLASPPAWGPHGFAVLCVTLLALLGGLLFVLIDAARGARKAGAVELRPYQKWYVYLAVLLIVPTLNWVIEPDYPYATYNLPTGSMLPTLAPGDHFMVETDAHLDRPPERGDLLVFRVQRSSGADYVKRLVGLPRDRVQMTGGILHINGEAVERQEVEVGLYQVVEYRETLPNGHSYSIREESDNRSLDNTREHLVPPDHYFFLGDNRDRSQDSRDLTKVGLIPASDLIGRVSYIYWSKDLSRIGMSF